MNNANENSSLKGVVKWFNDAKGFGFIQHSSGKDVFVHYSVISQEGFKTLKDGEEVEYELKEGPKGLQATKVNRSASALAAQVEQMTVASAATASAVSQITTVASASMASGAMGSSSMSGGMEQSGMDAPKGMVTQMNK
jgi:CspA family cold shock protein